MKMLNLFGVQPKAKYKSYKGDVGKTCKNLLLTKIVDKEKIIHITREILIQQM